MNVERDLYERKNEVLSHFRNRAVESLEEIKETFGKTQYKRRASAINTAIHNTKENVMTSLVQRARREQWKPADLLKNVLMLNYCYYVVMIEYRNHVWPYEYMALSRRVGELWEPFCKLCFEYPIADDVEFFVPPVFEEVRQKLEREIYDYIDQLGISAQEKKELKRYYTKVWRLVDSGAVKLELDLHFRKGNSKYVVDFKSGFGSNEKGNTNRLLLVATTYEILEEEYSCLMLVRSPEDDNNQYFQILKRSGLWEAYCGEETYEQVYKYTGFDIGSWINEYIDWENDFSPDVVEYFRERDLLKYFRW